MLLLIELMCLRHQIASSQIDKHTGLVTVSVETAVTSHWLSRQGTEKVDVMALSKKCVDATFLAGCTYFASRSGKNTQPAWHFSKHAVTGPSGRRGDTVAWYGNTQLVASTRSHLPIPSHWSDKYLADAYAMYLLKCLLDTKANSSSQDCNHSIACRTQLATHVHLLRVLCKMLNEILS